MKLTLNPATRRRWLLLAALVFTLWATWQVSQDSVVSKVAVENTTRRTPVKPAAAPALPLQWHTRSNPTPLVADLFSPPPLPRVTPPVVVPQGPVPPVFSLKYIGHLLNGDNSHVFLADEQDRVTTAKLGQTVGNDWQFTAMTASQLVFHHKTTGQEHLLQIGTL
jgi:hypothetical protein